MHEQAAQRLADIYHIPLDRAQAALILTQGDPLEAARLLEREDPDKERRVGHYSTQSQSAPARDLCVPGQREREDVGQRIAAALKGMLLRPTANHLEVVYPGGGIIDIPLLAALLLALVAFWVTAGLLFLGWITGCGFALKGPDIDLPWVNRFLEAACGVRWQLLGKHTPGKK